MLPASAGVMTLAALVSGATTPKSAPDSRETAQTLTGTSICGASLGSLQSVERNYVVAGRVRLLLFWTGRRDVGTGRIAWKSGTGDTRRLELLIGTDPDRAPRKLNRWGFIAETRCGQNSDLFGLMTQSDEETLDEAKATVAAGTGDHPYRAIRASQANGEVRSERLRMSTVENFTYRDLPALVSKLPAPGAPRVAAAPPGSDTGFLASIAAILHDSVTIFRASGRPGPAATRSYVYAGRVYDVATRAPSLITKLTVGWQSYTRALTSEFVVTNRATRETTEFEIAYGTEDTLAEVPVRIVYRPRWWLELQLTLTQP